MNKPFFAPSVAVLAAAILCLPLAHAQTEFAAQLAGHAFLPAPSFMAAPADAPADLRVSGKFTTGTRVERLDSVQGRSANRPTGISLPFAGQPLQAIPASNAWATAATGCSPTTVLAPRPTRPTACCI